MNLVKDVKYMKIFRKLLIYITLILAIFFSNYRELAIVFFLYLIYLEIKKDEN
jgi:hypothetical protein